MLTLYGERIVPFELRSARRWGALSAALGNDSVDLMIAATALEHGLTVVTRNVSLTHRRHRARPVRPAEAEVVISLALGTRVDEDGHHSIAVAL